MLPLSRRDLVQAGAAASVVAVINRSGLPARAATPAPAAMPGPFDGASVRRLAQAMAAHPYAAPEEKLPGPVDALSFDQYRGIRFRKEAALWRGQGLNFQVEFLPARVPVPAADRHLRGA